MTDADPTAEQLAQIADDARAFFDAAESAEPDADGEVTLTFSQYGAPDESYDDMLYRLACVGVSIVAAVLNQQRGHTCQHPECDERGEWVATAATLRRADDDPVGTVTTTAIAAAANHDADQTAAVLGSFRERHGSDGLAELLVHLVVEYRHLRARGQQ